MKPKFSVKWTKKDSSKTYTINAKTYDDVFDFFKKKNAAKEEWGKLTHEKPDISFKPAKGDPVADVTLEVGYAITMPSWSGAKSLGPKAKAAWDKMFAALEKHEDNHRQILEDQAAAFGKLVTKEDDLTQKKLGELFKDFPKDVKTAQDAYDTKTDHGEKEGVFLPAPDQVKD